MNDLIRRAMGAPKESPFSFMALLASVGGVPGMDGQPLLRDRAFFRNAKTRINGFASEHRQHGYSFFDLMEEQGFMPRATQLADWMDEATEQTIAHALGIAANDNGLKPRLIPPQAA